MGVSNPEQTVGDQGPAQLPQDTHKSTGHRAVTLSRRVITKGPPCMPPPCWGLGQGIMEGTRNYQLYPTPRSLGPQS